MLSFLNFTLTLIQAYHLLSYLVRHCYCFLIQISIHIHRGVHNTIVLLHFFLASVLSFVNFFSFLAQVTLLFPLFHEHATPQRVQDGEAEPLLILRDINDYNRRFSGQPRSVSRATSRICRLETYLNDKQLFLK